MTVPFVKHGKIGQSGRRLVAAGLEAVQPVLNVTRPPPDFARTNAARAGEVAASRAAIEGRARFKARDVEHIRDS